MTIKDGLRDFIVWVLTKCRSEDEMREALELLEDELEETRSDIMIHPQDWIERADLAKKARYEDLAIDTARGA